MIPFFGTSMAVLLLMLAACGRQDEPAAVTEAPGQSMPSAQTAPRAQGMQGASQTLSSAVSCIKRAFSGSQIRHNKAYFAGNVDYLSRKYNAVVANLRATRRASR